MFVTNIFSKKKKIKLNQRQIGHTRFYIGHELIKNKRTKHTKLNKLTKKTKQTTCSNQPLKKTTKFSSNSGVRDPDSSKLLALPVYLSTLKNKHAIGKLKYRIAIKGKVSLSSHK